MTNAERLQELCDELEAATDEAARTYLEYCIAGLVRVMLRTKRGTR